MVEQRAPEVGSEIEAGGFRTHYHDSGQGEPVLLVHGAGPGGSAWGSWRPTFEALGGDFRLIAPDMVGFGDTADVAGGIRDKRVWVDHLAAFLDALEIARVSLVGNSFGAAIAIAFAIAHPERVHRLTLMGALGVDFPITPALDFVWGYEPSLENMRRTLGYLSSKAEDLPDTFVSARLAASGRPQAHQPFKATFGSAPRQKHITMLASSEADIASIAQQALIVHGQDDQVIPLDTSRRLQALIGHADLHVFSDCGHWIQVERAQSFHALLRHFLRNGLA